MNRKSVLCVLYRMCGERSLSQEWNWRSDRQYVLSTYCSVSKVLTPQSPDRTNFFALPSRLKKIINNFETQWVSALQWSGVIVMEGGREGCKLSYQHHHPMLLFVKFVNCHTSWIYAFSKVKLLYTVVTVSLRIFTPGPDLLLCSSNFVKRICEYSTCTCVCSLIS